MNETVEHFLTQTGPVFCLDIGSGTQDALLALPNESLYNWPRWVFPSPARRIAHLIHEATEKKRDIFLFGSTMGGGIGEAVTRHIALGLKVYATEAAAATLHDDQKRVQAMGIELRECCPQRAYPIHLADFSQEFWFNLLTMLNLPLPSLTIASAQDHGFSPAGNRTFRMQTWKTLLCESKEISSWIYHTVPKPLTRLAALAQSTAGPVADTGTSALLGFLCEQSLVDRSFREGITLVNAGNTHILAALLYQGRVFGLYEQHTGLVDKDHLSRDLHDFRLGWLPIEQVQEERGHGTAYAERPQEAGSFDATFITGPAREKYAGLGRFTNPCGDMMQAGCFGLIHGLASQHQKNSRENTL
ncbi:MAG: hypothetical protein IJU76_05610 [Desulfovibrionaceae bacterium]|nr:hypothetical protein [Desulfovibrionaceae bacterium]